MRSKRYGRSLGRSVGRPSRTWADVSDQWNTGGAVSATTATTVISLQAPSSLASLTSDPPEDMTLLRIVGNFAVTISTTGEWQLAMLVQDTTWTPASNFTTDGDKRMLWSRAFQAGAAVAHSWFPPGYLAADLGAGNFYAGQMGSCNVDIKPMVKLEPGKALFLVAYEEAGASAITVASSNMRVLYQRSPRRR